MIHPLIAPAPPLLHPACCLLRFDDRAVLFDRRTGASLTLADPDPLRAPAPALRARLRALWMLADGPPPPLADLYALPSRLSLLHPDGLWHPDPLEPPQGGLRWRMIPLSPPERRVYDRLARAAAARRAITVADAAHGADVPLADALALTARLCAPEAQAMKLRDQPPLRPDPALERLIGPPARPGPRTPDQHGALQETTLAAWHDRITDGARHFDDVETTIAHAHALPHPGLHGLSYGARLADTFVKRGMLQTPILEIGPGDGELAEAFLARAAVSPADYTRLDASPELLRVQALRAPGTRALLGDATRLPLPDQSVGLLFANEVIADLSAVPSGADHPDVLSRLARYGIDPLPPGSWYNLGAWLLLEEIARVLRPGGCAWLSEFGSPDSPPEEAAQLDHPEISIHFGHLEQIARALGLRAAVEPLDRFLQVDLHTLHPARHAWSGLRAWARAHGRHLPARAWTAEGLQRLLEGEGVPLTGARMVPLIEEGPGPLWTRFWAISLWRV